MRLKQFQDYIDSATDMSPASIENRVRELRKEGLLKKGGRGLNQHDISDLEVARILLAIGGATKAEEAVEVVKTLGAAVCLQTEPELAPAPEPYLGCTDLESLFTHLVGQKEGAHDAVKVHIYPAVFQAKVYSKTKGVVTYGPLERTSQGFRPPKWAMTTLTSWPVWEFRDQHFLTVSDRLSVKEAESIKSARDAFIERQRQEREAAEKK